MDGYFCFLFAAGPLPKHNNVSWRGNSGMKDGISDPAVRQNLVGGFYDAGDAIKFNFPASFAMTMLSWSVIEYSAKYEAAGELNHIKETIKWGTGYLLKIFNSSADKIDRIYAQVGVGDTSGEATTPNDHYCWVRPEDIDYQRPVYECHSCPDLAAEMAAALAAASIVSRDSEYSPKLVQGSELLFAYAWDACHLKTCNRSSDPSSGVWDEILPGHPAEDILLILHRSSEIMMCSYLPVFTSFNRTKGGLIQLNHGRPQPLQYVVNAAFLATLYSSNFGPNNRASTAGDSSNKVYFFIVPPFSNLTFHSVRLLWS
ncbi:hypothetical protein IFM89_039607 [Coptis chinensis]|uniref:cellulase n=1 Tax=Coptis chinensis TaxID=261450 RepID=A0A835LC77_9MAGN|nr:hypothetical protein IFM89_039607 [Coptis chinensis]